MELKQIRCTNCGYPAKINLDQKQHTCEACQSSFISLHALNLNSRSEADVQTVKNNRVNLNRSIKSNDLNAIFSYTQNILNIIPNDFSALYFNAYASSKLTNPRALKDFLTTDNHNGTHEEIESVVIHMAHNIDLRERPLAISFTSKHENNLLENLKAIIEKRIEKENDYAIIKRDVFICYRSTDQDFAEKVLTELELDGQTCWVAYRNLRPDDNENYWTNIRQALKNCNIFLVISSQDAMLSKDIQKEIEFATEFKLKRLEYKIDESNHTSLFKYFFDGIKWIDAINKNAFDELKARVFDLSSVLIEDKKSPTQNPKETPHFSLEGLKKRAYFDVSEGNYDSALQAIEIIFNQDIEDLDAWLLKLLIQTNSTSVKNLKERINGIDFNEMSEFMSLEAYRGLERFYKNHEIVLELKRKKVILDEIKKIELENFGKEIEKKKLIAFNRGDIIGLEKLSEQFSHKILDDFLITLISHNYITLSQFEEDCKNTHRIKRIEDIFETLPIKNHLSSEIVKPYYEKHLETKKRYARYLEEEQKKRSRLKEELTKEIEHSIKEKNFSLAKQILSSNNDLFVDHPSFSMWRFYINYRLNNIEGLSSLKLSNKERKRILNDSYVISKLEKNDESFIEFITQIKDDLLKHRKRTFAFSVITIIIFVSVAAISPIVYRNIPVEIELVFDDGNNYILQTNHENGFGQLLFILPDPTKPGHTFSGWYKNSDFSGQPTKKFINSGFVFNYKLYPKWTVNEFLVTYVIIENHIATLSLGNSHTSFVTPTGRVLSTGRNTYGQLGDGTFTSRTVLTEITDQFNLQINEIVTDIKTGGFHSASITSTGRIFIWGLNFDGQLGIPNIEFSQIPLDLTSNFALQNEEKITDIVLGEAHTLALTSNGRLFTFGLNSSGQLGDERPNLGVFPNDITRQFDLGQDEKIVEIRVGNFHSAALTSKGRLFMWGANNNGQLGDGTFTNRSTPVEITGRFDLLPNEVIDQIELGGSHTAAMTSLGRVFIFGLNHNGQLGLNSTSMSNQPIEITNIFNLQSNETIDTLHLGGAHSAALTSLGRLFTWGKNSTGQLGDNQIDQRTLPTDIRIHQLFGRDEKIREVRLGDSHSAVLTSTGRVFVWGWNGNGQLGLESGSSLFTPSELTIIASTSYQFSEILEYGSEFSNPEINFTFNENVNFSGWFLDSEFRSRLTVLNVDNPITLYGRLIFLD